MGFHNDGYDCTIVPCFVELYCIEDDYIDGETFYANFDDAISKLNDDAISKLNDEQVKVLLAQDFYFKTDPVEYYNTPEAGIKSHILKNKTLRFSYAYIKRLIDDEKFNEAIDSLDEELHKIKKSIKLQKGDLVIIDNVNLIHGRESFSGTRKLARFWLSN